MVKWKEELKDVVKATFEEDNVKVAIYASKETAEKLKIKELTCAYDAIKAIEENIGDIFDKYVAQTGTFKGHHVVEIVAYNDKDSFAIKGDMDDYEVGYVVAGHVLGGLFADGDGIYDAKTRRRVVSFFDWLA